MKEQEEEIVLDFDDILDFCVGSLGSEKGPMLMEIGEVLRKYGQTDLGLKTWNRALQHFIETGLKRAEAACRTEMGWVYRWSGDHLRARQLYEEALRICEEIGDEKQAYVIRLRMEDLEPKEDEERTGE